MSSKCNSQAGQLACAKLLSEQGLRQRILVVDDDLLIRRLNAEMLIFSGYDVDTAEDGAVAWHLL